MKITGYLDDGDVLIRAAPHEIATLRSALVLLARMDSTHAPAPATPKPPPTRGPKAKAHACKGCGADRETTPWPAGGALCLACNRKAAMERYRAKHPATGMRAQIARDVASDRRKKNAPHGADRVKAAMHRIQEQDDRPHDGGRVLPIITE